MILNPSTDVGKRLLAYLRQNPITLSKLASIVGLSPITLKKLLEGQTNPRMDVVFTLEKFLNEKENNG
jgi:transcriptional regulator with XRE-family HTH domain